MSRTAKPYWVVRGSVDGAMYLRSGRGVLGEPRWAIKATEARRFDTEAEALGAVSWSGGKAEEVRP